MEDELKVTVPGRARHQDDKLINKSLRVQYANRLTAVYSLPVANPCSGDILEMNVTNPHPPYFGRWLSLYNKFILAVPICAVIESARCSREFYTERNQLFIQKMVSSVSCIVLLAIFMMNLMVQARPSLDFNLVSLPTLFRTSGVLIVP